MHVHHTALRHGIRPEAIHHAVLHAMVIIDLDDGLAGPAVLFIGPDPAGNLLEVAGFEEHDGDLLITHAMPLRRRYRRLLETR